MQHRPIGRPVRSAISVAALATSGRQSAADLPHFVSRVHAVPARDV